MQVDIIAVAMLSNRRPVGWLEMENTF